jgi:hypothetical protein
MKVLTVAASVAPLALIALLGSCSKPAAPPPPPPAPAKAAAPAPPSSEEAKTLIANSAEFSEYEFTNAATTLPLLKGSMNAPAQQLAAGLRKAGWIRFDGSGAVVLTDKASHDPRILVRPNGFVDFVPLAKKELTAVTAIRGTDVDFDWHWLPNDLGAAITSGGPVHDRYASPQHATATLIHDGTSWSVLRIQAR